MPRKNSLKPLSYSNLPNTPVANRSFSVNPSNQSSRKKIKSENWKRWSCLSEDVKILTKLGRARVELIKHVASLDHRRMPFSKDMCPPGPRNFQVWARYEIKVEIAQEKMARYSESNSLDDASSAVEAVKEVTAYLEEAKKILLKEQVMIRADQTRLLQRKANQNLTACVGRQLRPNPVATVFAPQATRPISIDKVLQNMEAQIW